MSRKPNRDQVISIRVTPSERRQLQERARGSGKVLSAYLRQAGLGSASRRSVRRSRADAVYHLSRIGRALEQLQRRPQGTPKKELERRLEEALRELLRTLGKLA